MPIRKTRVRWMGGSALTQRAGGRHGSVRSLTCNSWQDDATVKCWGLNFWGQLGQGDQSNRGDGSNGGCPARPSRGFAGRAEGWGWWLTVLPWRRDGGEPDCGRSGG